MRRNWKKGRKLGFLPVEFCPHIAVRRLVGKRMMFIHQPHESLLQHMRVNLRGGNVGMAEQLLHGAQVGAVLQQVTGKSVPQHVRRRLIMRENPRVGTEVMLTQIIR